MSRKQAKSKNQRRADWVRRRQNIARGMKIALHEVNQLLAPSGMTVAFGPGFIAHTIAIAEGGRINASRADQEVAFVAKLKEQCAARGIPLLVV